MTRQGEVEGFAYLIPQEAPKRTSRRGIAWAGGLALTGMVLIGGLFHKVESDRTVNRYPTSTETCVVGRDNHQEALLKVADKYWDGGDEIRGGAARMGEVAGSNQEHMYGVCYEPSEQHNRVVPADHIPPQQTVKPADFPGYTHVGKI